MPTVVECAPIAAKSGRITHTPPATYDATTDLCGTGQNTNANTSWRAFFSFDTSELPDTALISRVECLVRLDISQPLGDPDTYLLKFSIGSFIGAALDGTSAEWDGGTLMVTLGAKPSDGTWIDLDQDELGPQPYVNRTGDTDVKVWDDSEQGSGDPSWCLNFDTRKGQWRLRITYSVPAGTAVGRGTAQLVASVSAVGAGSATGWGTSAAAAAVTASASGTATGRGETACEGEVVTGQQTASGTATGRGFAFCRPSPIDGARHSGTRTVRVRDAGARSVAARHVRARAVAAGDRRVRPARSRSSAARSVSAIDVRVVSGRRD